MPIDTNWFTVSYQEYWVRPEGVFGVEDAEPAASLIRQSLRLPNSFGYSPVAYFRTHFNLPTLPPPSALLQLTHLVDDGELVFLSWNHPGAVLQTSPTLLGPWTNVVTQTNFLTIPTGQPAAFFRLE